MIIKSAIGGGGVTLLKTTNWSWGAANAVDLAGQSPVHDVIVAHVGPRHVTDHARRREEGEQSGDGDRSAARSMEQTQ